jgi:hypothetical protein
VALVPCHLFPLIGSHYENLFGSCLNNMTTWLLLSICLLPGSSTALTFLLKDGDMLFLFAKFYLEQATLATYCFHLFCKANHSILKRSPALKIVHVK